MDQKLLVFVCIAVAVGLAGGAGIGYAVFHEDNCEQTYWFYIDYGTKADDDHKNGWVSVTGTSTADAAKKIPGIILKDTEHGYLIDSINGIEGTTSEPWLYWAQFIRNGDYTGGNAFEKNWSVSNYGLSSTYCTCVYLAYGDGSTPTDTAWITTGPFETD